jgi:hypothetical protein
VTLSVPVSGVASVSTSCAPVAAIGPREAVQPISAFCRICEIGLSALPVKLRGAPRSAASRIADSATIIGAITVDARGAGGSGGNSASAGGRSVARGATKSITFRLATNETITTASAIKTVFRCIGRRIVPPDPNESPHNVLQRRRRARHCAIRLHQGVLTNAQIGWPLLGGKATTSAQCEYFRL